MTIESQIALCTYHYQKWKNLALSANSIEESRKYLERAFFWLELQTAFITLFAMEKVNGENKEFKKKLLLAKTNLTRKLTEYAKEILNEINIR
jgi:hypothetical protein